MGKRRLRNYSALILPPPPLRFCARRHLDKQGRYLSTLTPSLTPTHSLLRTTDQTNCGGRRLYTSCEAPLGVLPPQITHQFSSPLRTLPPSDIKQWKVPELPLPPLSHRTRPSEWVMSCRAAAAKAPRWCDTGPAYEGREREGGGAASSCA